MPSHNSSIFSCTSNPIKTILMAKVHPNAADPEQEDHHQQEPPTVLVLTVWRKSLLFNCHGFTVFDANGDLAFRVDCYATASSRRAEVVLMDAAGKPLLTVRRRKRLSLTQHCWVIYDGDGTTARPLLSVRRHASLRSSSKTLAHVTPLGSAAAEYSYVVEGSYGRRACAVRDARGGGAAVVAEVRRKESVGDDVFRLVADPRLGAPLAMGLVIALDEMFGAGNGSARSLLPRTWSV